MARFQRLEVLNEMQNTGLVPVFYHPDLETAKKIVAACVAGGVRTIEFTNRGDNAYRVFSDLVEYFAKADPRVMLGAGSVLDPATGGLYISSGANFIVGSVLNPELARVCNRRKVSYSPGCGSASEISAAEELGVEIVKIFPGDIVGGPKFVKAVLAPTPWTKIMPTGGVETTQESIEAWFKAGVVAVGVGSNLIRKDWVQAGDFDAISALVAQVISWIRQTRKGSPFMGVEHVGLYTHSGPAAQEVSDWYAGVFDFALKEGNSSFMVGNVNAGCLEIMKKPDPDIHCHIAVRVADFESALQALQAKGIEVETPIVKPDSKAVYLKPTDPAGNRVHLIWRRG